MSERPIDHRRYERDREGLLMVRSRAKDPIESAVPIDTPRRRRERSSHGGCGHNYCLSIYFVFEGDPGLVLVVEEVPRHVDQTDSLPLTQPWAFLKASAAVVAGNSFLAMASTPVSASESSKPFGTSRQKRGSSTMEYVLPSGPAPPYESTGAH
ncbi:hypothetical protein [Streptomyces wuyuanensis]|uniref:hypothetical protein n=1 Tax=Streptomyces wuyuanensis TaxID=1196353 RepID=UPI003723B9B8